MKNNCFEINVETRASGKRSASSLRRQHSIPGVIYGAQMASTAIYVSESTVLKYNQKGHENTLFTLRSKDQQLNNVAVLIKEIDIHPISRRPLHIDFYAVDLNKKVRVFVDVQFEGKAKGLITGGQFTVVNRRVEVECMPDNIPEALFIDISNLDIGDVLHVSDLPLSENIKFISHEKMTIAILSAPESEDSTTSTTSTTTTATDSADSEADSKEATATDDAKASADSSASGEQKDQKGQQAGNTSKEGKK